MNIMSTDRDIMMDVSTESRPINGECDSNIPPKLRFRGKNVQLHPIHVNKLTILQSFHANILQFYAVLWNAILIICNKICMLCYAIWIICYGKMK